MARSNTRATAAAAVLKGGKPGRRVRSGILAPRNRSERELEELCEALEAVVREARVTTRDLLDGLPQARRQVYRELYGNR